jgi:maltose alpha-D-glucosyltransferase/alpha-amylase
MIGFLTARGFSGIAPLLGEVDRVNADGSEAAMAMVQGFVANQGDGFAWTLDQLSRLLDTHGVAGEPDGSRFEPYRNLAHRMGVRLGEMHAILAQPSENPDFAPEPVDAAMAARWRSGVQAQVAAAFAILDAQKPEKGSARERILARIHAVRDALPKAIETILQRPAAMVATRIHGDLHLGQVLVTAGDVIFIDFEGEPLKTLAERRAKASPLRDVAGLLRSYDYAARIVTRDAPAMRDGTARKRALKMIADFRQMAAAAFFSGYGEGRGHGLEAGERTLLTVFALEKAAYEIAYEAAHRPQWLDLPLAGFASLATDLCGTRA